MPAFLLPLLPVWNVLKAVLSALFAFFSRPPGIYILIALLVVGAVWMADKRGHARGVAEQKAAQELAVALAQVDAFDKGMKLQAGLDAGMADAADHAGFLRGKAQSDTITITREIPVYVTKEVDRLYPLPCALYRVHEAAIDGVAPSAISLPAGLADGDACPVAASDFIATVAWNYGIDHGKDAQIIGLQDLARALATAINPVTATPSP